MKTGFTLLELMVVIVIIGILATLGLTRYSKFIEKSRGSEARQILGAIRSNSATIYMQNNNNCTNCTNANVGIGIGSLYPSICLASHYFFYDTVPSVTGFTAVATRCSDGSGKSPSVPSPGGTLTLTVNFSTGIDTWSTSGEY